MNPIRNFRETCNLISDMCRRLLHTKFSFGAIRDTAIRGVPKNSRLPRKGSKILLSTSVTAKMTSHRGSQTSQNNKKEKLNQPTKKMNLKANSSYRSCPDSDPLRQSGARKQR